MVHTSSARKFIFMIKEIIIERKGELVFLIIYLAPFLGVNIVTIYSNFYL